MKKLLANPSPHVRRNFFLIMKLKIFIILLAFQISASAFSQEARLNLSMKNVSIEDVLKEIQKQCDYEFFYAHKEINPEIKINLDLENALITEVLDECLANLNLEYEIVDNVIVIKPSSKSKNLKLETPLADIKIVGKVTSNEDMGGIPGVTILIKGTSRGITTDLDGNYTLDVPDANAVLVFSYIGFEKQEVTVGAQTSINIVLVPSINVLEEFIVTAIGTTVKVDQSATTSSVVKSADMEKSGEAGVINALSGKASGVQVRRSNGDPGAGSSIQIRGANTIYGDSQPLIIIDGTPVSNDNIAYGAELSQQSRLDDINSSDIESVQVLKGASAAAIWGSRAANGVIVITTKTGNLEQKPKVQYSFTKSYDMISVKMPLQNTYGQGRGGVWSAGYGESWGDKIADRSGAADDVNTNGAYFLGGITGTEYYPVINKNSTGAYTDSNYDQVFQTGGFNQHNISVSGGGKSTSYYFGLERMDQDGIIKNYTYERDNIRFNTKTHLYDWLKLNNKISYSYIKSNRIQQAGDNTNGAVLGLYRNAPDFDITDYKGQYIDAGGNVYDRQRSYRRHLGENVNPTYNNPLWSIYEQKMPDKVDHFTLSPELMIYPASWIKFIVRAGLDYYKDNRIEFFPIGSASGRVTLTGGWSNRILQVKKLILMRLQLSITISMMI